MPENRYEAGTYNAQCDRCGVQYKAHQLRKQWNNLRCCCGPGTNDCWEPRNVQESVRGKADKQAPPWTRPETDGPSYGDEVVTVDGIPVTVGDDLVTVRGAQVSAGDL